VTCTENLVKFEHVVFEICWWTDMHIDIHDMLITILRTAPGAKLIKVFHCCFPKCRLKPTACLRMKHCNIHSNDSISVELEHRSGC